MRFAFVLALTACSHVPAAVGGDDDFAGDAAAESQPMPADGDGVADPPSTTLHNHACGGNDWQHIHNFVILRHAAPELAADGLIDRCVARYAGWVTHAADDVHVSRASIYAALAATGQCDNYDGALVSGALCTSVHTDLDPAACLSQMASSHAFAIATVAAVIAAAAPKTDADPVLIGAYLGNASIACGGTDRWALAAPADFINHYVAAYNSAAALVTALPVCGKRVVVSVALYTGMGDPGLDGVTGSNGCWTYERISKTNHEWKVCGYDGSVSKPDAGKWVFDDTNVFNDTATEVTRIDDCMANTNRGYVYMANRTGSWPTVVSTGVNIHFAELYSSQTAVDDQLASWTSAGTPGDPMVNFGETATSTTTITSVTKQVCGLLPAGGYLGVYVYPEPLTGDRMSAMVAGLNACTKP
ncbi:MAG: hypothetical protein ABI591_19270 [Kofleriaceae bacterium]